MGTSDAKPWDFDLSDAIRVICNLRPERFPCERLLAYLTFNVWIRFPERPGVVSQGRFSGAAHIMQLLSSGALKSSTNSNKRDRHRLFEHVVTPDTFQYFAGPSAYRGSFHEEFASFLEEAYGACAVLEYVVRCPTEISPSLNKAFDFVHRTKSFFRKVEEREIGFSRTEIKHSWFSYSKSAAFILVAKSFDYDEFFNAAPDDGAVIVQTAKLLKKTKKLKEYFGVVRSTEDLIQRRLKWRTMDQSTAIPSDIEPVETLWLPLKGKELEVARSYSLSGRKLRPNLP